MRNPIARGRGPAGRRTTSGPTLPRRLRDLLEAALMARGDRRALLQRLGTSPPILRQRLSMLKALGIARTVTIFDPRRIGRPIEIVTLVAFRPPSIDSLAEFEALLVSDPCVTMAARVCGRFDYQLTSFHEDIQAAEAWRRSLAVRSCIAELSQRRVTTLAGHQLADLPLLPF